MQSNNNQIDEAICFSNSLETYDPYDIWKTRIGLFVKNMFNSNRITGAAPALLLTLVDQLINNRLRWGYSKQEYPIVRALAAQILLQMYQRSKNQEQLVAAERHIDWLVENTSKGYSGACWGLGFKWPAGPGVIYDANTPHATHTPYALEALHIHRAITRKVKYEKIIKSCYDFLENDLITMYQDSAMLATSYGPFKDRIVTNAISYVMYCFALLLFYIPEQKKHITTKIQMLYSFLSVKQRSDGSWLYSPDDENSFIDCFHSCFILKNLIKTNKIVSLPNFDQTINKGYGYLCSNFYDAEYQLYKRFTKANKLSLVKFDLYDNSEMLNLTNMMSDRERSKNLMQAIRKHFVDGGNIYSVIDFLNIKRNKNMLRWAVMPYLYALSGYENN